jgi:hypothetical protein
MNELSKSEPVPQWTAKNKRLGQIALAERTSHVDAYTGKAVNTRDPLIEEGLWNSFSSSCPSAKRFGVIEHETLCLASAILELFSRSGGKLRFLELCCGKGFLTHCLNTGQCRGQGTDRSKRAEWSSLEKLDPGSYFESELRADMEFADLDVVIAVRPRG